MKIASTAEYQYLSGDVKEMVELLQSGDAKVNRM